MSLSLQKPRTVRTAGKQQYTASDQCRINNSSKYSNCYGSHAFWAPRSSVINLIYHIMCKIFFSLKSQYFAEFSIGSKRRFSVECCLCPEILV